MQDFREHSAYRVSLYLLLAIPALVILVFLSEELRLGMATVVFLISIPTLFLVSLWLRLLSRDTAKHWSDIILSLFAVILLVITNISSSSCLPMSPNTQYDPQWTLSSILDSCSPYSILGYTGTISTFLFFISLILVVRFLVSNFKRKN